MDLRRRRRLQGAPGVDLVQCSIAGDVVGQLQAAVRPLVQLLVVAWISRRRRRLQGAPGVDWCSAR
ncbi:hypothetical protein VDS42_19250, partial [Xanthomonas campestris pv. campestris]|nr:hypothetical protein [Xanthomonas campestris pv. campestris]